MSKSSYVNIFIFQAKIKHKWRIIVVEDLLKLVSMIGSLVLVHTIFYRQNKNLVLSMNDWKKSSNQTSLYKEVKGYLVTLECIINERALYIPLINLHNEVKLELDRFLKIQEKEDNFKTYTFEDHYLKIELNKNSDKIEIESIVATIIDYIETLGHSNDRCLFCEQSFATNQFLYYGIFNRAHEDCLINELAIEKPKKRSYKKGILGSIVISLVYVGLYLAAKGFDLAFVALKWVEVGVYILLFMISLLGYALFKGKLSSYTKWILGLILVMDTLVMNAGSLLIEGASFNEEMVASVIEHLVNILSVIISLIFMIYIVEKSKTERLVLE